MALIVTNTFNAVGKPLKATTIIAIRLFVLAIPLAKLGAEIEGLSGLYTGIFAASSLTGLLALAMVYRHVKTLEMEFSESPNAPEV